MLQLKNIVKDYSAGELTVHALRGVSLDFRESEFVSVLGPSGCGKTTLLNIIGGLDQYTDGDLRINGRSTKDFRDRDWDTYRNHSIGFVFQSYNLIPHQTVLQNVEIALTLSGVGKAERSKRAIKALEDVGLGNQLKKRQSEMSGGQMQRVAIARALVNDPDIILADEPTGALDTETSVQVMEILKSISKDRLIIMVTHNPDLAEKYSTRIIRMLDGQITSDSSPLTEAELKEATDKDAEKAANGKKIKKPSMSFFTAFSLSLKNLFTKKGRTLLTSFAGSIGIIGIALIYAMSNGATAFINSVQEETLSSYPLVLQSQNIDLATLLNTFMGAAKSEKTHENDAVYKKSMVYDLINALNNLEATDNDLASFKKYLEEKVVTDTGEKGLAQALNGIRYSYDLDLLIYTENIDGTVIRSDTEELSRSLISDFFGMTVASGSSLSGSSTLTSLMNPNSTANTRKLWQEMLPGKNGEMINDLFYDQYDVVYGDWPKEYNEIVLVVDRNNELDDMTLYALGLISKEEIDEIMQAAIDGDEIVIKDAKWSYEEIVGTEFRTILNSDCYVKDELTGKYNDLRETEAGLKYLYSSATPLKVSGIIRKKPDVRATVLNGSIAYTSKLTEYVVNKGKDSEAVKAQLADTTTDIFSGLPFRENTGNLSAAEKASFFKNYAEELDSKGKAEFYIRIKSIPEKEFVDEQVNKIVSPMTREQLETAMLSALENQMSVSKDTLVDYIKSMSDEEMISSFSKGVEEQVRKQYADSVKAKMSMMPEAQLSMALASELGKYTDDECAEYYDTVLEFSDSTLDENLNKLGDIDLDDPSAINLYASSFENKEIIEDAIAEYNESVEELKRISYTDVAGIVMSSVTVIVDAISYVLIAFVSISLVVSSIMIGVITLISVQERTKEIGILRAIGASKRNVSSMFNAETVIIGFAAGLLGVLVTYLLCIPGNIILHSVTGLNNLSASLPVPVAAILVLISILLTLIAGVIPSRSAAKKDPVVALRTE